MNNVLVVGAGPAGMLAAGVAAARGARVTLVEKNDRPGRKLGITGKGRCNLTNDCGGVRELLLNVPRNPRFLYSSLTAFGPAETMAFFEKLGVPLKVERGRRVFPVSDKAGDIVRALQSYVKESGCRLVQGRVVSVLTDGGAVSGVKLEDGRHLDASAVLLCTGGRSYPATGSTGDGYAIARALGHTVTPIVPSLVPIVTREAWPTQCQGLSLRNTGLRVTDDQTGKTVYSEQGELLFTHFGLSGPLILSASAHLRPMEPGRFRLSLDLKPALSHEKLEQRLQRDFIKYGGRDFANSLGDLLPQKLITPVVHLSGIPGDHKTNQITKEQRTALAGLLKELSCTAEGFRPIEEAIVTSGGVEVSQVDPKTMQSKLTPGLYFAGELLDCDAYTGGFNLQIAFATGYAAGMHV